MSDYIERQAAIDVLKEKVFHNLTDEFYGTMQVLDELPSADVEPVRHGRWIRVTKDGIDPQVYCCDVCGRFIRYEDMPALLSIRYPYCHCGARMDGEQGE